MAGDRIGEAVVIDRKQATHEIDTEGTDNLPGVRWVRVNEGNADGQWTVDAVRRYMAAKLDNNNIDEVLIRGDDGGLYMVYADSLPRHFRKDSRFVSGEVSGTIIDVSRELDADKIVARTIGHGITAVALGAAPFTMGMSAILWAACGGPFTFDMLAESYVHSFERDTSAIEKLSGRPPLAFNDPRTSLKPPK